MTRDDVDAVIAVFTPDGTYSAFGSTYALDEFPALVAAAPKGLFLTGTPELDLDGDRPAPACRRCASSTRPTTTCASASTPTRYRRTELGWRLHTRSMTFLRRSGARDAGKEHDPRRPMPQPRWGQSGARMELADVPPSARRLARRARRRARRPMMRRSDLPRGAHGAARQGQAARLRRRLDAVGMARARRRPRRLEHPAGVSRRGADLARPGGAGRLLHDRGAGADDDRLRTAPSWPPRWCRGCCAATRPGAKASPSRAPEATSRHCSAARRGRTMAGGSADRRCGRASRSTPTAASC